MRARTLKPPLHRQGRRPLDVVLTISEVLPGLDSACLGHDLRGAVLDLPCGRSAALLAGLPRREVGAVEQDDRVRGWRGRKAADCRSAGIDDRRTRPTAVVDPPIGAGKERRVVVAGTLRFSRARALGRSGRCGMDARDRQQDDGGEAAKAETVTGAVNSGESPVCSGPPWAHGRGT